MWVIVTILTLCGVVQGVSKAPLVSTKLGQIEGLEFGDGHAQFLGVPYAVVDENNPFGVSFYGYIKLALDRYFNNIIAQYLLTFYCAMVLNLTI